MSSIPSDTDDIIQQHEKKVLSDFVNGIRKAKIETLASCLPLLLNLNGRPMTLKNHPTFEEAFRFHVPPIRLWKTARQVGKTTMISASGILRTATIDHYTLLYVLPLFEQVRRLSTMFVGPIIQDSPIRSLLIGPRSVDSVLQKIFSNRSKMLFSFAFLSARRVRGIPADEIVIDEVQDMDVSHIPIIQETISMSEWALQQYTGTPLSEDNTIQQLWNKSSQAEWFVPCLRCTTGGFPTWNIPTKEHHLEKMIGNWSPDISEIYPATICYKCGKSIFPRLGRWVARYPKRHRAFAGYHIPQLIIPAHYAKPEKWATLLQKRNSLPAGTFWNEVMGESYDRASKLVTITQLLKVATLGENSITNAVRRTKEQNYVATAMGIDWGGGGESGESLTSAAYLGLRIDGVIEVPWGIKLLTPHDHILEASQLFEAIQILGPEVVAHDFGGSGAYRETILVHSGVSLQSIMPCVYVGPCSNPMYHVAPTPTTPRDHYRVDKTKTLQMTCGEIQLGRMLFFNFTGIGDTQEPGLLGDFLALMEEKHTTIVGEMYRITKMANTSDDFAQAVNYATVSLWYRKGAWPKLDLNRIKK